MTSGKTQDKNLPQTQQQKQANSIAGSMLRDVASELGLEGLFGGKIVHVSFDCPLNLREAFKTEIMENKSSQCKELQKFMLSYIVVSRLKKHALGNTLGKLVDVPFTIGELNLNQYVQSRPRRYVKGVGGVKRDGSKSERFYCPLDDEWVPFESLPLQSCLNCPNSACRKYVMSLADREGVS